MRIVIHWMGNLHLDVLKKLAEDLKTFNAEIGIGRELPIPAQSYDIKRRQHNADRLLEVAVAQDGDKVLCVVPFDMYTEPLSFVFGEAQVGGRGAVISTAKLGGSDDRTFRARVIKEATHELGHTFGLDHCPDAKCVMHFSRGLSDTDYKNRLYCEDCRSKIPSVWRPRQRSPGSC